MSEGFPETLAMPDSARYSERYPMAMAFAALKHAAQERKDAWRTPYIAHPLAVSVLVWQHVDPAGLHANDLPEDLAIAALLHDVAEDAGGQEALAEISELFGDRVAEIVDRCSDALPAPGEAKAPWQDRKERHVAQMARLAELESRFADPGACLVIACDKLHNLSQTAAAFAREGEASLQHFNGGVSGTRWYYRAARQALAPGLPPRLVADLDEQLATIGA